MSELQSKKPPLKLKLNLDYLVIFETQPGTGKGYKSEEYGTMSYLYFLEVYNKQTKSFEKERWYANEKQQKVLEESDLKVGEEYVIVKEEIEGSKAQNFWVYDKDMKKLNGRGKSHQSHVDRVQQAMTSDDLPPLEDYLKDPEATQSIDLPDFAPINANKTQAPKQSHKDGQTMGMCFKIACEYSLKHYNDGSGYLQTSTIKSYSNELYGIFQELMSE